MQNETPFLKLPLKGELLRRCSLRFPGIDVSTIEMTTHLQSVGRAISALLNSDLAPYGLTEGKFYVLAYLTSEEALGHDAPSPSAIADNLGVTRGTITGLLDGLEREGYLERCSHSSDRRALTIQMTDKTRQFMDRFGPASINGMTRVIPLDDAEKQSMTEQLARIDDALHHVLDARSAAHSAEHH